LAFSIWKVHNNPDAAIPACASKLDNMEPYGRIPMLTHALHGTGARQFVVKSPDGQGKANRSYSQETLR
jgi:hypothetical protein